MKAVLTLLVTSALHRVAEGELSFLERQQLLAKQMWEDEMELAKASAGGGAAATQSEGVDDGASEDYYGDEYDDGYYDDDYEVEKKPAIRFVPKEAPKRKVKGYKIAESVGFQDILKPITYMDLLTSVATLIKCHSDGIDAVNNAKRGLANKGKEKEKPAPAVDVPAEALVDGKPRKLSFKEKQERKMRERQAKEKEMAKPKEEVKHQLGAECEDLICSACGAVVEEFGEALHRESENPAMEYVSDVAKGFCDSKEIRSKYGDLVGHICKKLFNDPSTGHLHALMHRFEETTDWDQVTSYANMYSHRKEYCSEAMMCKPEMFVFKRDPTTPHEEDWTKECFTCHAVANHIEAKSGLYSNLKDPNRVVREACDRLRLPGEYDSLCREMFGGSRIDDVGWLVKVHHEAVMKQTMAAEKFPSYMCGEIKQCVKLEDLNKPMEQEIDAPFW